MGPGQGREERNLPGRRAAHVGLQHQGRHELSKLLLLLYKPRDSNIPQ